MELDPGVVDVVTDCLSFDVLGSGSWESEAGDMVVTLGAEVFEYW